jgi:hypothetical protein
VNNDKIHVDLIHPRGLIKKEKEIFQEEIGRHLDKNGRFKYGYLSNCPVCESEEFKVKFFKNGFEIRIGVK